MGATAPGSRVPALRTPLIGRDRELATIRDQGLDIFTAGAPSSRTITCDAGVPVSTDTPTTSAGASSLTYDPTTDQYTYVWKTNRAWAGSCRQLELTLADGTTHIVNFKFK